MADVLAPAKVNLTLHVTGQKADGYHLLDSLVVFADKGDRITVKPAAQTRLRVTGRLSAGVPEDDSNLVMRAAKLMDVPVEMVLEKHLPNAAGLGGGSSDAAVVLRALSRMTGQPVPDGAERLGADVPVCLMGGAVRMRGIGDDLSPVTGMPPLEAVLVNPGQAVPTAQVFQHLTERNNAPMPDMLPEGLDVRGWAEWLGTMRNDLEAPAVAFAPVVGEVMTRLRATPGCLLARMSGSGGTCFGIFDDQETARSAAGRLREQMPSWWVLPVRLNG